MTGLAAIAFLRRYYSERERRPRFAIATAQAFC
jgi:hypothetical protein